MTEEGLLIPCAGESLVAVLSRPAGTPKPLGLVIVVGGPQVRTGSHRQFTRLARAAARAGFAGLRFDLRGMGDSSGDPRPYTDIDDDIQAAIDALLAADPRLQGVLLWGLCDAATAIALYLHRRRDARVRGACLVNPWVRSVQSLAQARVTHYYRRRLLQREFWGKLLTGGVGLPAWRSWREQKRLARGGAGTAAATPGTPANPLADQVLSALQAFEGQGGRVRLVLAEADLTAQEFAAAQRACHGARPPWPVQTIAGADHTCSTPDADATLMAASLAALQAAADGRDA